MTEEDTLVKCYCCHKPLLQERVIGGKVTNMIHPESDNTEFYLNNNSRMPVRVCHSCKDMDLDNPIMQNKIMKNIIDGWQVEQNILLQRGQITQEQSDMAMGYHKGLAILFKSEKMDDSHIRARLKCL